MSPFFWLAVALFVLTDVVVVALVIRRNSSTLFGLALPGGDRNKVLTSIHAMVGDYLREHYTGDLQQLPAALSGLVPQLRDLLRSHGVEPRPEIVRALIEISAARHRVASARELREALASLG